jgi:hypothetical protein
VAREILAAYFREPAAQPPAPAPAQQAALAAPSAAGGEEH